MLVKFLKTDKQIVNLISLFPIWKQIGKEKKKGAVTEPKASAAWREIKELRYLPGDSIADLCQSLLKM